MSCRNSCRALLRVTEHDFTASPADGAAFPAGQVWSLFRAVVEVLSTLWVSGVDDGGADNRGAGQYDDWAGERPWVSLSGAGFRPKPDDCSGRRLDTFSRESIGRDLEGQFFRGGAAQDPLQLPGSFHGRFSELRRESDREIARASIGGNMRFGIYAEMQCPDGKSHTKSSIGTFFGRWSMPMRSASIPTH